jgi:hypothetical protein
MPNDVTSSGRHHHAKLLLLLLLPLLELLCLHCRPVQLLRVAWRLAEACGCTRARVARHHAHAASRCCSRWEVAKPCWELACLLQVYRRCSCHRSSCMPSKHLLLLLLLLLLCPTHFRPSYTRTPKPRRRQAPRHLHVLHLLHMLHMLTCPGSSTCWQLHEAASWLLPLLTKPARGCSHIWRCLRLLLLLLGWTGGSCGWFGLLQFLACWC